MSDRWRLVAEGHWERPDGAEVWQLNKGTFLGAEHRRGTWYGDDAEGMLTPNFATAAEAKAAVDHEQPCGCPCGCQKPASRGWPACVRCGWDHWDSPGFPQSAWQTTHRITAP